jgi:hypothetical protein
VVPLAVVPAQIRQFDEVDTGDHVTVEVWIVCYTVTPGRTYRFASSTALRKSSRVASVARVGVARRWS